jgi:hypothetical protein
VQKRPPTRFPFFRKFSTFRIWQLVGLYAEGMLKIFRFNRFGIQPVQRSGRKTDPEFAC